MAKQLIGIGSTANDGTGDNLRVGADKVNDNFNELYTAFGDGSTLTSGTFITNTGTVVLSNKTVALGSNTVSGTTAQFNTALTDGSFATLAGSEVLTNKTINGPDNTLTNIVNANLSGSAAISNANLANNTVSYGGVSLALGATDATPAFDLADATNYSTSSLVGTITNGQLDGAIANNKLANSTISIIADDSSAQSVALGGSILFTGGSGITTSISGNEISFVTDGSIVTETSTDTLTNKTINGPDNTLTNIANASLANTTVTLGATSVALGATAGSASNFNLSGTSSISGSGTVDTTGSGNKLRFNVAAADVAALGTAIDPSVYEGMFAYNTTNNIAYVADTGGWKKLLDENGSIADFGNVQISGISNGQGLVWSSGDGRFNPGSVGGFSAGSDLDQAGADVQDVGYVSHRSPDATVTQTLTVTVATKTTEHTAYGDGSSSGYLIDGHEGAHLQLSLGVYKFDQADSSNSGHPLLFYKEAAKTTAYTTSVTTSGTPGSSGAHTTITITKDTPSTLHYQCSAHATMGGVISVVGSENFAQTTDFGVTGAATVTGRLIAATNGAAVSTDGYHQLVGSNANFYNLKILNKHASPASQYITEISFAGSAPDNSAAKFIQFRDTTTARLNINSDGDLQNHDNSYGAISDERIKQNIVDAGSQWDDIKNIRVRKYKKKDDVAQYGADNAPLEIGVISQELETVSPGLVKEDAPDSSHASLHSDFTGDSPENVKYVKYSILYMKAIKALQEAQTRIETLETKVTALENE